MVEELPLSVLAPFIKGYDESSSELIFAIPQIVRDRLDNPNFTSEQSQNPKSSSTLHLIPTTSSSSEKELTIDEQVKKRFDNQDWRQKVQKKMAEQGFIRDKSTYKDEPIVTINYRNARDDLFSVRIDNLPENFGSHELEDFLTFEQQCRYFTRIVVPRDEHNKFKRFGFIKFDRLRYAIKFIEDYAHLKIKNMMLNVSLVV